MNFSSLSFVGYLVTKNKTFTYINSREDVQVFVCDMTRERERQNPTDLPCFCFSRNKAIFYRFASEKGKEGNLDCFVDVIKMVA
jgi:hypothetical protein